MPNCLWLLIMIKDIDFSFAGKFAIHPLSFAHIRQFVRTVLFLLFPNSFLNYIKENLWTQYFFIVVITGIFIIMILITITKLKKKELNFKDFLNFPNNNFVLFISLLSFSIFYFIFLIFSISFMDFNTPLDYRISSPGIISFLLSIFILPTLLKNKNCDTFYNKYFLNFLFLLVFVRITFFCIINCKEGFGYNSKTWKNSEIFKTIDFSETEVYSNSVDGIYFITGKLTKQIPSKINVNTGFYNKKFYDSFSNLIAELKAPQKDTVIIFFNSIPTSKIPMPEEFLAYVKPDKELKTKDAIILYYARKNQNRLD